MAAVAVRLAAAPWQREGLLRARKRRRRPGYEVLMAEGLTARACCPRGARALHMVWVQLGDQVHMYVYSISTNVPREALT
jgi:hypothetical protein